MKLKRLLTLVEKERKQMLRESSNIAIGIILPVVMLLIFGYGMSMDVRSRAYKVRYKTIYFHSSCSI